MSLRVLQQKPVLQVLGGGSCHSHSPSSKSKTVSSKVFDCLLSGMKSTDGSIWFAVSGAAKAMRVWSVEPSPLVHVPEHELPICVQTGGQ